MPYFSTKQPSSLAGSLRRLIGGGGGLDGMQQIQIEQAAADTAQKLALAEKTRAEVEAMRSAETMRNDPAMASRYASHTAGLDEPTGARLGAHLRGAEEPFNPADADDAGAAGIELKPYRMAAPNVEPAQRQRYQQGIAALIANQMATGKTNADQLTQAQGNLQTQGITEAVQAAVRGGQMDQASAMNQGAKPGTQIRLHDNVGSTGATFSPATGVVAADPKANPLIAGTIKEVISKAKENDAQADNSRASAARTRDAMTRDKKGVYDSARGILVDPITGQAREIIGADGKPVGAKAPGGPAFKDVTTLRKEFNDQAEVKAYRDVLPIVESARSTPDTRAGDIQIAYAVGKILDPASVVREGELKLVGNAATLPEKVQGELRTLVMGKGRMTPETRGQLMQMLDVAVGQREASYRATADTYKRIAEQNGFPVDQVLINPPKAGAPKPEATRVINGVTYVKINGKWMQP